MAQILFEEYLGHVEKIMIGKVTWYIAYKFD